MVAIYGVCVTCTVYSTCRRQMPSKPVLKASISPLHAELHGLPPTLIHVGDAEVILFLLGPKYAYHQCSHDADAIP